MKNAIPVYAVVRIDPYLPTEDLKSKLTIKEIVLTKAEAEKEIERLNRINSDKQCEYFCVYTRLKGKIAAEE